MLSFVILCYQLIATVTIYFAVSTDSIMKIYRHTSLYWKLEIYNQINELNEKKVIENLVKTCRRRHTTST